MKYFAWFKDRSGMIFPCMGPHFHQEIALIGSKQYHSIEEILSLNLPKYKKEKIQRAKPDDYIVVTQISALTNLVVKIISEEEIAVINKTKELKESHKNINKEIQNSIPKELYDKKYALEKEIRQIEKKLKQSNLKI